MEKLRAFKQGGNALADILEEVMEDHDPESSDVLRIVFERMLTRHWDRVKPELEQSVELLVEIANWPEVTETVLEAQDAKTPSDELIEQIKRRAWEGCMDVQYFVNDLRRDFKRAILPRE